MVLFEKKYRSLNYRRIREVKTILIDEHAAYLISFRELQLLFLTVVKNAVETHKRATVAIAFFFGAFVHRWV